MDKQTLITYGLISLGIVLGARFFANALFVWIEGFFLGKKPERSLDDMVRARLRAMGVMPKSPPPTATLPSPEKEIGATALLPEEEDPEAQKRKALLRRIYELDLKQLPGESAEAFARRVLGVGPAAASDEIKRAFKTKSKELHPDTFRHEGFDAKTRAKLEARVHANYLAVKQAYETLTKKRP